jgi:hypothetical protein
MHMSTLKPSATPIYAGDNPKLLWDDNFTNGPQGWEELFMFPADWNTQHPLPPTLSTHGKVGKYALKLQTNNIPTGKYGGDGFVLKRMAHLAQPGVSNPGVVKAEYWFSMGSDAPATANGYDAYAPRAIEFNLDSQYPTSTQTTVNNGTLSAMGNRAFFTALWQQSAQSGGSQNFTGQWYFNQGSGIAYGTGGYLDPTATTLVASGYYSNIFFNQNKRNMHYVSLTYDTYNGMFKAMQVNHLIYDLTKIPSLSNAPLTTVLAPGDPTYNVSTGEFAGGLNPIVQIGNVSGTGFSTASFLELHRTRGTYL